MAADYLTPRQIADRLGLAKTDAVLAWVHAGELAAVNVSSGARPTWRIPVEALDQFLDARRAVAAPTAGRRTRRRTLGVATRYF